MKDESKQSEYPDKGDITYQLTLKSGNNNLSSAIAECQVQNSETTLNNKLSTCEKNILKLNPSKTSIVLSFNYKRKGLKSLLERVEPQTTPEVKQKKTQGSLSGRLIGI